MFRRIAVVLGCVLGLWSGCTTLTSPGARPGEAAPLWGDYAKLVVVDSDGIGSCSGWMLTETLLVTAGHCVDEALFVHRNACFYPDFECINPVRLTLVGTNHKTDVAVFRLPKAMALRPNQIRTTPLTLAETVLSVGYPFGEYMVDSGLFTYRRAEEELWDDVRTEWLQHSADSGPGSSGGQLYDARGRLVGMIVGSADFGIGSRTVSLGIAVPVDVILSSVDGILKAEQK